MLTDSNYTYYGEHLVMYVIVQSLGCTPETNIVCQLHVNKNLFGNLKLKSFTKLNDGNLLTI